VTDLAIDKDTNDLVFSSDGFLSLTTDAQALAQRLDIRLAMVRETYFLNLDFGVPYYTEIFRKGVTKLFLDSVYIDEIYSTPGVGAITSYKSTFDTKERSYSAKFTVTYNGATVEVSI